MVFIPSLEGQMRPTPLPLKSLPHCRSCHAYGLSQHRFSCNPDVPCRIPLGSKPRDSAIIAALNDRARLGEDQLPIRV